MISTTIFIISLIVGWRLKSVNLPVYIRTVYGEDGHRTFWKYGNTLQKLDKAKLDVEFLHKCRIYNVFPKFLRFKLYKSQLYQTKFYESCQKKLLASEIKSKECTVRKLGDVLVSLSDELRSRFSWLNFALTCRFFKQRIDEKNEQTKTTHRRKLRNIGITNNLNPCNPEKTVLNYSSSIISPRLRTLLAFGLDFCLPVYKLNYHKYFLKFERFFHNVMNNKNVHCTNPSEFQSNLRTLAYKYFYNFKPFKVWSDIFKSSDIKLLRKLAANKDVVVCKPDKGRGVVIVDRSDYIHSLENIISDESKFKQIDEPIQSYCDRVEGSINNFLRSLKSKSIIDDATYKQLYVTGSGPGILYGLPKVHKANFRDNFPFRPIFAAYKTAPYKLAKFLVPILAPFTSNKYTVDNSYSFVRQITSVPNADNYFMASFDVENLFTNIPLAETIDICIQSLFTDSNSTALGMDRNQFRTFLQKSVLNSFFMFNDKLFKQIEGLGMGLPLGPSFANIFMSYYEQQWLDDCPVDFKPAFYRRYVDDTFLLFHHRDHAEKFLTYLNEKHSNIKFTMESEQQNSLSFLDVLVCRCNNSFGTSVYRKESFTGVGTSFFSYCPFNFKINSIKTLVHRAYHICSNNLHLHNEFNFLLSYFTNNGYPSKLVHSCVRKFLDSIYCPQTILSCDKFKLYVSFPYFGPQSFNLKKDLLSM